MTVADLIHEILNNIRNHFYNGAVREFARDQVALTKAIMRYGHECNQRGWQFEVDFLFQQLSKLLLDIRKTDANIKYFPLYLESAITRSVGQKAEELQTRARSIPVNTAKIVKSLAQVNAVREPTAVEICTTLYRDLKVKRKQSAARRCAGAGAKKLAIQKELL